MPWHPSNIKQQTEGIFDISPCCCPGSAYLGVPVIASRKVFPPQPMDRLDIFIILVLFDNTCSYHIFPRFLDSTAEKVLLFTNDSNKGTYIHTLGPWTTV